MKARADLKTSGCSSAEAHSQALGKRYRVKNALSNRCFFERFMFLLLFLLFSYLLTVRNLDAPHLIAAFLVIAFMATAKEYKRISTRLKLPGGEAKFSAEVGGERLKNQ